jgi:hypothetical protein
MIIAGVYSFNGGSEFIEEKCRHLLDEVEEVIATVDSA